MKSLSLAKLYTFIVTTKQRDIYLTYIIIFLPSASLAACHYILVLTTR